MSRLKFLLAFLSILFADPAWAQLTHVDTLLASAIAPMIPSSNGAPARIAGDSSIMALVQAIPKVRRDSLTVFYINPLTVTVEKTDSGARMDIMIQGGLINLMNAAVVSRTLSRSVYLSLSPEDWNLIDRNGSRYVHVAATGGFWSNVLEPALVILGAAAVVALFFLIRS